MTTNELLRQLRKSCVWIASFAAMFVLMYFTLVMLLKYSLLSFAGLVPDVNKNLLRLVFYGLSATCAVGLVFYKKRRYSKAKCPVSGDGRALARHIFNTFVLATAIAQGPAICGFFLVFLGELYFDFYLLSVFSLVLIYTNIPTERFLEKQIKNAV